MTQKKYYKKNTKIAFASPPRKGPEKEREKKRKAIAKLFALHAKAIKSTVRNF